MSALRKATRVQPLHRTPRPNDWTQAEQALLRANYPASSQESLRALFPARTWKGIVRQACKLAVRRRTTRHWHYWTQEELELLRSTYPTHGLLATLAALPGRSNQSVRQRAHYLGLKAAIQPRPKKSPTAKQLLAQERREARSRRQLAPKSAKVATAKAPKPAKPAKAPKPAPIAKAQPLPGIQTNTKTPVLNAAKASRIAKEKRQKPASDWLEQMKKLPPNHPARMAYTIGARTSGAAGKEAYFKALKAAA